MRRSFRLWASSSTTSRWNGMAPLRDQRFAPGEQLVRAHDRLRDVVVGAALFQKLLPGPLHRVGGREQHRYVAGGGVALQPSRDLEPVHGLSVQVAVRERHV